MVTIRDVAKRANVSVATVSRVLNNKGYISDQSRKKVKEAMEKLNYRPNAVARTLYSKSSRMLGLIMPDITNPFFPELAKAVEDKAYEHGYTVVFCNTDGDILKEEKYLEVLAQNYIDGIILTTNQSDLPVYDSITIPIVALDRHAKENIPTVVSENEEGANNATTHLIKCGCKFIAHIRGPQSLITSEARVKGFLSATNDSNIKSIIKESAFNIQESEKVATQMMKENPNIDGIFASSDVVAAGVIKAVNNLGLAIPRDIQIVGFDGIPMGQMLTPTLTTVKQPIYDMGALVVELLLKKIEKKEMVQSYYKLPTDLIIGETTKQLEELEQ